MQSDFPTTRSKWIWTFEAKCPKCKSHLRPTYRTIISNARGDRTSFECTKNNHPVRQIRIWGPPFKQFFELVFEGKNWKAFYLEYLKMDHWVHTSTTKLHLDKRCQRCYGRPADQVHHLKYNLWHETMDELLSVCDPCHLIITEEKRKKKNGIHKHELPR